MKTLLLFTVLFSVNCFALILNPNDTLTPGWYCDVKNPDFLELRYKEKVPVCKRNVSDSLKKKVYTLYKVPASEQSLYTIDHKISLAFGGSNDIKNLWPQPKAISSATLEGLVYNLIKDDRINRTEAVNLVLSIKHTTSGN